MIYDRKTGGQGKEDFRILFTTTLKRPLAAPHYRLTLDGGDQ